MNGRLDGDATIYRVSHQTKYQYASPVVDAYTVACLVPRHRSHQQVLTSELEIDPEPTEFDRRRDVFGNHIVQLGVHQRHDAFHITATSEVAVAPMRTPSSSASWEQIALLAARLSGRDAITVGPYRALTANSSPSRRGDLLDALVGEAFTPGRPALEAVRHLCSLIFERWSFDPSATDWATPLDQVLEDRRGVCQDFAHLATAACRAVGLPSAYVSGYIETDPPPGQPKLIGADASHAWCSVWIPDDELIEDGAGGVTDGRALASCWFDVDPTNDLAPPSRHVTVGWGRDFADVSPVRGVVLGPAADQSMWVAVDVARLAASTDIS